MGSRTDMDVSQQRRLRVPGEWNPGSPARSSSLELMSYLCSYPCGGGVEYLHRDPANRKRRRNGTKKKGRAIA
jgi:hypothetical protein